ncbi:BTAD domain-containing putative transcriptional regulator [Dactylosporangium sp. NPDC051541]|uniref:AfsR/SARP family transcriptional regulator n=1 Tax=Dactylosporangium sp. NPDC051541 TaxID=3363977 RepID=UPI003791CD0A
MRLWRDGVELDAGPRQQAYLLALLLANAGRPVSRNALIEQLWDGDDPDSAVNIIRKYVGLLRRVLEPELPIRGTGSYVLPRSNGYTFLPGAAELDLVVFRELIDAAKAARDPDEALGRFVEALELWHGHAGGGLDPAAAAMAVFAALDAEFFAACLAAAELALAQDRPGVVLKPLRLAAAMAPLHEGVQASLVTVLATTGQQAEALEVYGRVRDRLAAEVGVAPGPALLAAHRRVTGPPRDRVDAASALIRAAERLAADARLFAQQVEGFVKELESDAPIVH